MDIFTKAFMLSFSQAINYELRGSGVTVTCLCPGPMATNFARAAQLAENRLAGSNGVAMHAKHCAVLALNAMFNGKDVGFVSRGPQFVTFLLQCCSSSLGNGHRYCDAARAKEDQELAQAVTVEIVGENQVGFGRVYISVGFIGGCVM